MNNFPDILPAVTIEKMKEKPFVTRCEQEIGTFVIPRVGERSRFAEYTSRKGLDKSKVVENTFHVRGEAYIHGVRCVEVVGTYANYHTGKSQEIITFDVVTGTHVQTIAALEERQGVKYLQTFLDEDFHEHWAFGENNCGMEIELKPKGIITCDQDDKLYSSFIDPTTYDIVGRYHISIGERVFDTIRMVIIGTDGQMSDFYIDREGREIMHRFFLADEIGLKEKDSRLFSEKWPDAERMYFNDRKYICNTYGIPDYAI